MPNTILRAIQHLANGCEPPQDSTADYWSDSDCLEAIRTVLTYDPVVASCPLCKLTFED